MAFFEKEAIACSQATRKNKTDRVQYRQGKNVKQRGLHINNFWHHKRGASPVPQAHHIRHTQTRLLCNRGIIQHIE
jgi:hypothetical protein